MEVIAAVLDWLTSPQGNVVILSIIVAILLGVLGWTRLMDFVCPLDDDDPDWPRRRR